MEAVKMQDIQIMVDKETEMVIEISNRILAMSLITMLSLWTGLKWFVEIWIILARPVTCQMTWRIGLLKDSGLRKTMARVSINQSGRVLNYTMVDTLYKSTSTWLYQWWVSVRKFLSSIATRDSRYSKKMGKFAMQSKSVQHTERQEILHWPYSGIENHFWSQLRWYSRDLRVLSHSLLVKFKSASNDYS